MTRTSSASDTLQPDRGAARVDARNLALELAGLVPGSSLDAMVAGLVLRDGEVARRLVGAWVRQREPAGWSAPGWCQITVTDLRLLVRLPTSELASLWWGSLAGLEVDLDAEHVVLDFADGFPRLLSGTAVPVIAVAGVAAVYGVEALVAHPALSSLREDTTS